ncbi:hypothetical protein B0H16DRAFT_82574 [Mycena metata]|uniref:F-box domain-containing protein n=1 Tax=Mycena metata TaxID=1033252 RepID=A0AAD7K1K4_9AGAR|nr:hypothetical protein B0H16DRAFT_82574 [Mycena metata]
MSIKDLETRIEALSIEIERQKEVLNQLQRSKTAAQRELNTLRDPIAHLPLEISSEIFLQCLPPYAGPTPDDAPMLLLNICSAWTTVALSTPALWAYIHIDRPCAKILQIWLQRARGYPLSVNFDIIGELSKEVAIAGQYSKQLKHLQIFAGKLHLDAFISLGPFPSLETLMIGSLEDGSYEVTVTIPQIIGLLTLAPNLEHLAFHCVETFRLDHDGEERTDGVETIFPNLLGLKIGDSDEDLLRYISLPNLTTLLLPLEISLLDFPSF